MENNIKEELEKIKTNETGKSIGIISTIIKICGAVSLVAFLIYGFINFDDSPIDIILFAILGIISIIISYIFSTLLSMFQEMHYVIVHLDDLIKKDN